MIFKKYLWTLGRGNKQLYPPTSNFEPSLGTRPLQTIFRRCSSFKTFTYRTIKRRDNSYTGIWHRDKLIILWAYTIHISQLGAWVVHWQGHGFDSRSSRHVGTLGKSFTHSCLWRLVWNSGTVSVLGRERLWVAMDLKRRYRNSLNEWMN